MIKVVNCINNAYDFNTGTGKRAVKRKECLEHLLAADVEQDEETRVDVSRVTPGLVTLNKAAEPVSSIISDAVEQAIPLVLSRGEHISLGQAPRAALVHTDKKDC